MKPSSRGKAITLPVSCEGHYRRLIDDLPALRRYVNDCAQRCPELFPQCLTQHGFTFHDRYDSKKLELPLRRIKVSTGQAFLLRPSFALPYMTARVGDVEKGLYLRQWGVPFDALAYVCGRNAKFWERQWLALGRPTLVGTTIKKPEQLPTHLIADEKHTRHRGTKVYVPTTVAAGCLLGATVTKSASEVDLNAAYGEFAAEARDLDPDYRPRSICLDGWSASHQAWRALFPKVLIILCFLHAVLKIIAAGGKRCSASSRHVLDWAWQIYRAPNKRSFGQQVRRLQEWTQEHLPAGKLQRAVLKLCSKRQAYAKAYDQPQACRTTNALDRLMDYQDRLLYAQRYFHGGLATARQGVRAQALLWNFHPYGERTRRQDGERHSPFQEVNGFVYHDNWLENFLIASSMGGRRL